MTSSVGLFPSLLAQRWNALPASVRALHGSESKVIARGRVDVRGHPGVVARCLRAVFGLPAPRTDVALEVEIARNGVDEFWRRDFGGAHMTSRLRAAAHHPGAFEERLGAATFVFEPVPTRAGLQWMAREARLLAVRLPLRWFGGVDATCSEADHHYRFDIAVCLPLLGVLVGYAGWLEVVDAD